MSVKRGDVVLYSLGGREYNALVLAAHNFNDSHLGKNGEPQLHLSVLFDDPKTARPKDPGFIPEPTTVHDVVHASHEFSADYMHEHGLRATYPGDPNKAAVTAEIRSRRGAGEWSEVPKFNAPPLEVPATIPAQEEV